MVNLSWWPKDTIWATGGYNVGYWPANAELWFKRRIDEIRDNNKQVVKFHSQQAWRSTIKFFIRDTKKIIEQSESIAKLYLGDQGL